MTAIEAVGLNHALWAWYPSAWIEADDAFDLTRGEDPDNHAIVDNPLVDVVARHWRTNEAHPETR